MKNPAVVSSLISCRVQRRAAGEGGGEEDPGPGPQRRLKPCVWRLVELWSIRGMQVDGRRARVPWEACCSPAARSSCTFSVLGFIQAPLI